MASTSSTTRPRTAHFMACLFLVPALISSISGCKTTQPDSNQRIAQLSAELEETNQKVDEMYHRLSVVQFMAESHERMLTGKEPSVKSKDDGKAPAENPSGDNAPVLGKPDEKTPAVKEEALPADAHKAEGDAVSHGDSDDESSESTETVEVEVPVKADEAQETLADADSGHAGPGVTTAKTDVPVPVVNVKGKPAKDIYALGFSALKAKDYPAAAAYFRALVTAYPAHDLADNAVYWTGEIFYDQKDYKEAIRIFNRLVETYPAGGKVPDALLKIGFSYHSMKDRDNAVKYLKKVVVEYPFTDPGSKAEAMLNKIERPHGS